ncbi:hypothetical protein GCM10010191_44620 [Actinomadura vinacea]|uniref:ESAT-6-like protein n=1 Tax=Actinomadura vinacea TaxID=115336 RepID=A0ABN3JCG4_9ACTN
MGQNSAADRAAMQQAAEDIDASANIIKGLKVQLLQHKDEVRAGWEGNASMTFDKVFTAFDQDFGKVLAALEGMYTSLTQNKITYESNEEMTEQAVNKVQDLLNNRT